MQSINRYPETDGYFNSQLKNEHLKHLATNNKLMNVLDHVRDVLLKIIYALAPKLDPNYDFNMGKDINKSRLMNHSNLAVNKQMFFFTKKVSAWWNTDNPNEVLSLFIKNIGAKSTEHARNVKLINKLVNDTDEIDITAEDKKFLSDIEYRFESGDIDLIKNLSLRHMKILYNSFVKCMNYLMLNDKKEVKQLSKLEDIFILNKPKSRKLLSYDRAFLKKDKDFIKLLYLIKENSADFLYRKESNDLHQALYHATRDLLEDSSSDRLTYGDVIRLKSEADRINKLLLMHDAKPKDLQYELDIFQEMRNMGLVSFALYNDIQVDAMDYDDFSYSSFRRTLSDHGFSERFDELKKCIEDFPSLTQHALDSFDLGIHHTLFNLGNEIQFAKN